MVASALICGLTPSRTLEKITIGNVVDAGPAVKLAITRSSSDRVKASSQPATSAGAISGRVMTKNTFAGPRAEIERRLLERAVEGGEPRLDDDRDKGEAEGDMRDRRW